MIAPRRAFLLKDPKTLYTSAEFFGNPPERAGIYYPGEDSRADVRNYFGELGMLLGNLWKMVWKSGSNPGSGNSKVNSLVDRKTAAVPKHARLKPILVFKFWSEFMLFDL